MKTIYLLISLVLTAFFVKKTLPEQKGNLKMTDIQVIGSHNSYKMAIEKPLFEYLLQKNPAMSGLEYEHITLSEQLELGLRSLELDVFHDPEGGYYSNPKGLEIVKAAGAEPKPFDEEKKLQTPGLKVFHVQEIDFRSHQLVFKEALEELKSWSDANEGHNPIIITINTKDGEIPNTRKPLPFDVEALKNLNAEILAVFSSERLVTPDLVRGDFDTLEEAVLEQGWPLLSKVRNRFLFVLDEGGEKMETYLSSYPNLKGAALFVNQEEGNPTAAFRILNDPIESFEQIKKLVSLGYMVHTRADANTQEARDNDYNRFEKAKASGAQIITTDYYLPSTFFKSDFKVSFENDSYERIRE
ncbi:phosphatidylinositol-specific phospholipase C1-like protein [Zobellia sp. B3R18]|uniref:phosphatidylinositol-specific phospholipase C1-like protein n=1 Tax=Zobellia sp. B3R18 TaxID=2841568 RepID=UPI001C06D57D|nr:phosphatidylinositol-specific phospholipase C1-like protein [Zobellia sp. B3R18]MBU2974085.1 phosphatidylinositol-specific phospholipase C1-like protein [Zobellia sp. B3R18]